MKEYFLAYGKELKTAYLHGLSRYAKVELKCLLKGYCLKFSTADGESVVTLEKRQDGTVPVIVWGIYEKERLEKSYPPHLWNRLDLKLKSSQGDFAVFTFVLKDGGFAVPIGELINAMAEAYSEHGFDLSYIENAADEAADFTKEREEK